MATLHSPTASYIYAHSDPDTSLEQLLDTFSLDIEPHIIISQLDWRLSPDIVAHENLDSLLSMYLRHFEFPPPRQSLHQRYNALKEITEQDRSRLEHKKQQGKGREE